MSISVVFLGQNHRLLRAVSGIADTVLAPDADLRNRRILFAAAVDDAGPCPVYYAFLRRLRREPDCLAGSTMEPCLWARPTLAAAAALRQTGWKPSASPSARSCWPDWSRPTGI